MSIEVPLIERVYRVRKPNGKDTTIKRFDLNLALATQPSTYVQCDDTSWIQAYRLRIIK